MKKIMSLALTLMLLLSVATAGFAESAGKAITLTGNVVASETLSVMAPYGGTVESFSLRVGDQITEGDSLFSLSTTKIYAPTDGVVSGLFAQPGDNVRYITDRYGALMYIEPNSRFVINTSVSEAYDKEANRIVHVGETVYLRSTSNNDRIGEGFVTSVDGKNFSVEVTSDNLRFDENVAICRESDFASDSRIGRGKTSRIAAAAVTGVADYEGSVLAIHVSEGDKVQRGQLMAETVTGALPQIGANPGNVTAKVSGVIASVNVAPGDTVNLDQVLATVHPSGSYQVAADINEVDLMSVSIGNLVSLEFRSLQDMKGVRGTIASISAVSSTTTGDAEYTLYIDFDANAQIREGMTVTVNLN